MLVSQHLNLNVTWLNTVFFNIDIRIAKTCQCLCLGCGIGIGKGSLGVHNFHTPTTTTGSCLDDDRKTDLLGNLDRFINSLHVFLGTGQDRHAMLNHSLTGRNLITHHPHAFSRGADESNAALFADLGKLGIFRQKAVAGMDRLGIRQLSSTDDGIDIQVALAAGSRSDTDRFISQLDMQRIGIGSGIDRHCLDPQFFTGPDNPDGNLTTVGDKNFMEHYLLLDLFNNKEGLTKLNRLGIFNTDLDDLALELCLYLIEKLHRLNQADNLALLYHLPYFRKRC